MNSVTTLHAVRSAILPWREAGETIALVPTMGALHKGHRTLIEAAQKIAKRTIAYIFVNPTQFGPGEDFSRYPRPLEADTKFLVEAGCDLLYTPGVEEIYPEGFTAKIDPGPLATVLEGEFRPHFFYGVATVVIKFLLQIMPDAALFGEKDYQQLLVIRRVVRDLDIPVHIVGVPTVRDADGLAFSSRNAYLSPEERKRATALPLTLVESAQQIQDGKKIQSVLDAGREKLAQAGFAVDYLELADAATLAPVRALKAPARLLAAGRIGQTRLIDNVLIGEG